MRILLIEDEPGIADFVEQALRAQGHQVDVATTASTASATRWTSDVDLVILDRMLPGRDGIEVLARHPRAPSRTCR